MSPAIAEVLDYMTAIHEKGLSYSTVNIHRSMLSSTLAAVDGYAIGQHPLSHVIR